MSRSGRYRGGGGGYRKVKWSNETMSLGQVITAPGRFAFGCVPETILQGMRKAKNFRLKFSILEQTTQLKAFVWALVYVPEGTAPGQLGYGGAAVASLYEPNQNMIMCGVGIIGSGSDSVVNRFTKLARNLNSGDQIALIVQGIGADGTQANFENDTTLMGTLNYSITL